MTTLIDVETLRANLAAVLDAIAQGDTAEAAAIVIDTMTALDVAEDQMRELVIDAQRCEWASAVDGSVKH